MESREQTSELKNTMANLLKPFSLAENLYLIDDKILSLAIIFDGDCCVSRRDAILPRAGQKSSELSRGGRKGCTRH